MLKQFQTPNLNEGFTSLRVEYTAPRTLDLPDLNIPHDNKHHVGTIQEHIARVKKLAIHTYGIDSMEYALACYHDCGKAFVKSFTDSKGEPTEDAHYYNHENVGAYLVLGLKELKHRSESQLLEISWYVNMHMTPFFEEGKYFKNLPETKRKILYNFHDLDVKGA